MPKEYINNRAVANEDSQKYVAEVQWSRDMFLSLGVRKLDGGPEMNADGFYVDLDREGVNRLIRVLRKARDQAFGADA